MDIGSHAHKWLRRVFEKGNSKDLAGDVNRVRRMLAFIDAAETLDELPVPPNYGLHELTGDRSGIHPSIAVHPGPWIREQLVATNGIGVGVMLLKLYVLSGLFDRAGKAWFTSTGAPAQRA